MTMKKTYILTLVLTVALLLSPSCKRNPVEEPGPFGPASLYVTFDLAASPNVLYTTDARAMSEIRALVKIGGDAAANQRVYFTIIYGPGMFSDYSTRTYAYTSSGGYAIVTYYSPTKYELSGDTFVTIKAQPETSTPYYTHKQVDIRLLKGQ